MTSHTTSFTQTPNLSSRRPSISSRLSFAISTAEEGGGTRRRLPAQQQIEEEIAEIKRYEDFTTIDWVQDAAREQARRKSRRRRRAGLVDNGMPGWRYRLWESYDAAQGWLVVTLIGIAIGLNAAFLNIITEWLSDIKMGYCSGISEIKCIIAGFVMKGFLGFWTLVIKSVCLPLAIASGLSVGKEGPSVHYAVCTGNVISRLFAKYRNNASKTREILSACAAAGVAVAFGSPIGGVLFSLEEMSSYFPLKTLWRSYFCALVAVAVLAAMNPFRTGQLVMFQVSYDRDWHFFETFFYIVLGIFGGLYGAFVMKWNLRYQAFRKKYLFKYPVLEATLLAFATGIICYPNVFLRIDMTESMEILFLECEGGEDYHGLCEKEKQWWNVFSLSIATVLRIFLVIISYGCKVPAGIFVPSMAIGASFGRTVGILPDEPCITPGTYAFLGSAAALSGIMHITVSVVVIMFELTGALTYILPTMIVVGVTKAVSDLFGHGGIANRMIWFSGFPFLDNKEEHNFGVPVSEVMGDSVVFLPAEGMVIEEIEQLLEEHKYQGFPIVEDARTKILAGYIGRTELQYALERIRRERTILPQTNTVDFSRYIDSTPVTVHPRLQLETVMELFRKIGPRVILIEYHGKLAGLVTVKDCLKYQFKVEAAENPRVDRHLVEGQERLWTFIRRAAGWVSGKVSSASGGRIRLSSVDEPRRFGGPSSNRQGTQIMDGDEDDIHDGGVELEHR
ncbi:chloride channel protein like [Verticillium longisporum]|uniref:Chloride channel protein like n=1 Tax=Verticillium longisporum TaxID=100787 RepID=A0A8I2Z8M3_VERLO|nr:chloride channel protein like [Verticillium longisporum]